jgi:hypothetical protein
VTVVVLDVVEAVLVGFPDLQACTGDEVAVGVGDGALDPAGFSRGAGGHVAAQEDLGGALDEEGADDGGFGGVGGGFVVDVDGLMVCMDAPRTSESRMNSWRRSVVMCPAAVRKSMACCHSASVRRTSRMKTMQVSHQCLHHLLEPGVRRVPERCEHRPDQLVLDLTLLVRHGGSGGGYPQVLPVLGMCVHAADTSSASWP